MFRSSSPLMPPPGLSGGLWCFPKTDETLHLSAVMPRVCLGSPPSRSYSEPPEWSSSSPCVYGWPQSPLRRSSPTLLSALLFLLSPPTARDQRWGQHCSQAGTSTASASQSAAWITTNIWILLEAFKSRVDGLFWANRVLGFKGANSHSSHFTLCCKQPS